MDKIIEVKNLKKSYGSIEAVKDISFYVERGKLFSFLGPNGAGKSTTIDILCTLLAPDAGEVAIDGCRLDQDDAKIRSIIGIVFQDSLLDPLLTVEENLATRAAFYTADKKKIRVAVAKAAEATGIADLLRRPYGKLSGGQRRRADISRALVNTPKILFLDEPTTGLDPQTRQNVWETVRRLKDEAGMTVFLTTHYMEEADKSDYVIIIDHGEIAASGTPFALKEKYSNDVLRLVSKDEGRLKEKLDGMSAAYTKASGQFIVKLPSTLSALPILEGCKDCLSGFEVVSGTLDDAFIAVTGKELRE